MITEHGYYYWPVHLFIHKDDPTTFVALCQTRARNDDYMTEQHDIVTCRKCIKALKKGGGFLPHLRTMKVKNQKAMTMTIDGEVMYTLDGAMDYINATPPPGAGQPVSIGYGGMNHHLYDEDAEIRLTPALRIGKSLLFRKDDLDAFIAARKPRAQYADAGPRKGRPGRTPAVVAHKRRRTAAKNITRSRSSAKAEN